MHRFWTLITLGLLTYAACAVWYVEPEKMLGAIIIAFVTSFLAAITKEDAHIGR